MLKKILLLFLLVLISACSTLPDLPGHSLPTHTSSPTLPLVITSSPVPFETPSPTPTFSPSPTVSLTPTQQLPLPDNPIPVPLTHIFPIQPPAAGSFLEGTASHGYPATDIFAVVGTDFVAVTDGVVDFVSYTDTWDPAQDDPATRGGLSVAIIGDDGLRYYGSHLSSIAAGITPGVRVWAGQLLGLVGNTGDARNTTSHLHFGISRPTFPEDWKARRGQIDPFPFLTAWKAGHNVTPPVPDSIASPTAIQPSTPISTPNLLTYIFPVQPPSAASFSQGGHPFPATDIFAPFGTKFVAVTNGTIDEVSTTDTWNPAIKDSAAAGGLSVRLLGDDGMHYYGAHLSSIAYGIRPGVWVGAGQLLGYVGNSGDARTTTSHVHFEISSPVPPYTKLDPFPYLSAWLTGQAMTPELLK